jgi:hypothetical protein
MSGCRTEACLPKSDIPICLHTYVWPRIKKKEAGLHSPMLWTRSVPSPRGTEIHRGHCCTGGNSHQQVRNGLGSRSHKGCQGRRNEPGKGTPAGVSSCEWNRQAGPGGSQKPHCPLNPELIPRVGPHASIGPTCHSSPRSQDL